MEPKRRQMRSRSEKRIQEASGRLRPGALELLLGAFGAHVSSKNQKNDIQKAIHKSIAAFEKHFKTIFQKT